MIDVTLILIWMVVLFAALVALQAIPGLKFCALCGTVLITWLVLLIPFYLKNSIDPVLVGLLMGGSVVGGMYLLEAKLPEKYHLFKLPYYLTLVSVGYLLLTKEFLFELMLVVVFVWVFAVLIFVAGKFGRLKNFGKRIIECCKNW